MSHVAPASTRVWWTVLLVALLASRAPAIVEPVGNYQSLYMYVADVVRAGGVPYIDAWDQKPPGIHFFYAALRTIWPHASLVAVADLVAAGLVAWLLVVLGRRLATEAVGAAAAALFLLFGHPSIARLSGVYVRGQCEVFIALAVAAALTLVIRPVRGRGAVLAAGLLLGCACWLKYNALAYALPLAVACVVPHNRPRPAWRAVALDLTWMAAGVALVSVCLLTYFAWHHAFTDLWLATITYNIGYSRETYAGRVGGPLAYLFTMPLQHARVEMTWFLGCAGALLAIISRQTRRHPSAIVALSWLAAAILSIAVNGARELPQYFVQAWPALMLCAAVGFRAAWRGPTLARAAAVVVLVLGLWRVGDESRAVAGLRWGGMPQLVENIGFDLRDAAGSIPREAYLERFRGGQKYDAAAVDALTQYVTATTAATDRILVFGFAPGAYVESGRRSASRFFWSRPVIMEFAADHPGYGSRGLLDDLRAHTPALVALQKQDWAPDVPNSIVFFERNQALHDWLTAGYVLDRDLPLFSVWRRRS